MLKNVYVKNLVWMFGAFFFAIMTIKGTWYLLDQGAALLAVYGFTRHEQITICLWSLPSLLIFGIAMVFSIFENAAKKNRKDHK